VKNKPQLHWSHINTYLLCGYLYYLVYIKGRRRKGNSARYTGQAVHLAAGATLQNKVEHDELLPTEQVCDIARDEIHRLWTSEEILLSEKEKEQGEKATRDVTVDLAVSMSSLYQVEVAPRVVPMAVEEPWVLVCPGFPYDLAGRRDVTELDGTIRDLKTIGTSAPAVIKQEHVYQLATYALVDVALKQPLPKVAADYVAKIGKTRTSSPELQLEPSHIEVVKSYIEAVQAGLDRQIFNPALPGHWIHSPGWCGFWDECKYGGGGKKP
jgi:hypothetical protein